MNTNPGGETSTTETVEKPATETTTTTEKPGETTTTTEKPVDSPKKD